VRTTTLAWPGVYIGVGASRQPNLVEPSSMHAGARGHRHHNSWGVKRDWATAWVVVAVEAEYEWLDRSTPA